jgi:hypothetical protein
MTSSLTYLVVQAQEADLGERARRATPHHVDRIGAPRPGRLRTRTARLLVRFAVRLDDRLQPQSARVAPSGARI